MTIAFAYGHKPQVINIGIDIMQLIVPRGISARKFADSFAHKVRYPRLFEINILRLKNIEISSPRMRS